MEVNEQHCAGTVLFQPLAIKWEAVKGTFVTIIPWSWEKREKGICFSLDCTSVQHTMAFTVCHFTYEYSCQRKGLTIPHKHTRELEDHGQCPAGYDMECWVFCSFLVHFWWHYWGSYRLLCSRKAQNQLKPLTEITEKALPLAASWQKENHLALTFEQFLPCSLLKKY